MVAGIGREISETIRRQISGNSGSNRSDYSTSTINRVNSSSPSAVSLAFAVRGLRKVFIEGSHCYSQA